MARFRFSLFSLCTGLLAGVALFAFPAVSAATVQVQPRLEQAQFQVLATGEAVAREHGESQSAAPSAPEPAETAFEWRVEKTEAATVIGGLVPTEQFQRFQRVRAPGAIDGTRVGAGAADGFAADALLALDIVARLQTGAVAYDGSRWTVSGQPLDGPASEDIAGTLTASAAEPENWQLDLSEPETAPSHAPEADSEPAVVPEPAIEEETESAGDVAAPVVDPQYRFSARKPESGALSLRGNVPGEAVLSLLANLPGQTVDAESLTVNRDAPSDFFSSVLAGIAALEHLETGQATFAGGNWRLAGRARIDTQRDAAVAALDKSPVSGEWQVMVSAPSARDVCRASLDQYMEERTILFASGSASLAANSLGIMPDIADRLNICSQAIVYVEGHTDSVGGDAINLPLSVARAEAVVDELIALGVSVGRLYAVGYGSSLPIATNDTVQGREQNRRIVFTFEDAATHLEEEAQEP